METEWIKALVGGLFIGGSVSLMLYCNGRITGISGIINGAINPSRGDTFWRILFIVGLLLGGIFIFSLSPASFENTLSTNEWTVVLAGLLVGFGTVLGNGCTSGHGICGVSRLSPRSILATLTFISAGIFIVTLLKMTGVFE